jgi:hypothetical protein
VANSASRYVRGVAFSQAWGSYRSHQEEERSFHRSPARRYDEPPTGYSSAGCSPAVPASASPAGCYSETRCRSLSIGTQIPLDTASQFQRWLPAPTATIKRLASAAFSRPAPRFASLSMPGDIPDLWTSSRAPPRTASDSMIKRFVCLDHGQACSSRTKTQGCARPATARPPFAAPQVPSG